MPLVVLPFPSVLRSAGSCGGAVTIMETLSLVFSTWRKSKTLFHQKQTGQQYKDAFHPTNIPLLFMAIY